MTDARAALATRPIRRGGWSQKPERRLLRRTVSELSGECKLRDGDGASLHTVRIVAGV